MNENQVDVAGFFSKHKKVMLLLVGLIALGAAGLFTWNFVQSQPVDVSDLITVKFTGYDGQGLAEVDYRKAQEAIITKNMERKGASKDFINSTIRREVNDGSVFKVNPSEFKFGIDKTRIFLTSQEGAEQVEITVDKLTNLKNGDEITITIDSADPGTSRIKSAVKKVKVTDLEKIKEQSTSDLLQEYPLTYTGIDGFGRVTIPKDKEGNEVYDSRDQIFIDSLGGSYTGWTTGLSNGDEINYSVTGNFLDAYKKQGQSIETKEFSQKVEGLKKIEDLGNLKEAKEKSQEVTKNIFRNTDSISYTLEPIRYYYHYDHPEGVFNGEYGSIDIVQLYKVTRKSSTSKESVVYYAYAGYQYRANEDYSFNVEKTKEVQENNSIDDKAKSQSQFEALMKEKGYKELPSSN